MDPDSAFHRDLVAGHASAALQEDERRELVTGVRRQTDDCSDTDPLTRGTSLLSLRLWDERRKANTRGRIGANAITRCCHGQSCTAETDPPAQLAVACRERLRRGSDDGVEIA